LQPSVALQRAKHYMYKTTPHLFLSFPYIFPSLSWYNDRFQMKTAQKRRYLT
jgi:hypothetical protein